jgi:GT2 family glycosyltransferase
MSRIEEHELTVVIPTLGRAILQRCLAALAESEARPGQIIVVDQGRMSEIERLTHDFRAAGLDVVYLPSSQKGRAAGLNTGIAQVRTTYLAITDDDCLVAPDWTVRLIAQLRSHARAIVTGRVEAGDGEVVLSVVTSQLPAVQRRPSIRFDRLSGGNMGMATRLARELGPFDEDSCLRTAEDAEFAYRALRAGATIVYAPDAVVSHLGWRNAGERAQQYQSYGSSQGGFYGKYLRRGDAFIALRTVVHLMRSLRRWWIGALRGDREQALNGRSYVVGLLPGIVAGWRSGRTRR